MRAWFAAARDVAAHFVVLSLVGLAIAGCYALGSPPEARFGSPLSPSPCGVHCRADCMFRRPELRVPRRVAMAPVAEDSPVVE